LVRHCALPTIFINCMERPWKISLLSPCERDLVNEWTFMWTLHVSLSCISADMDAGCLNVTHRYETNMALVSGLSTALTCASSPSIASRITSG
jgi:hypothetical protein